MKTTQKSKNPNHTERALSDEGIVALYFDRNEDAIRESDRKYGRLLLSLARGLLSDEADCEECVSDTYLGAWNAIPPTRPDSLRAFLTQILRRLCIDRYRARHTRGRVPSEYTASLDDLAEVLCTRDTPERAWEDAELSRLINGWLATLSAKERYLFVGRFYMARTLESLADATCVHVSTVHRTLARLKESLRAHLERNGIEI